MVPDLKFVKQTFDIYNDRIFGGALPTPRIRLTHARTFQGKMCFRRTVAFGRERCSDFEMRISLDFDLPMSDWEDVVIHEMIHLHIAANGLKDTSTHGQLFCKLMGDINRLHGRKITVSARRTKEQIDSDKRVRGHYLCLVRFHDGRLGVAPVAKSRIFELWNSFALWTEVKAVSWIGTIDPWFNRFPRVMKTKVYIASDADVAPHMKGALRLERQGPSIRAVAPGCEPEDLLP